MHLRAILEEIPLPAVTEINLKITYLKLRSNLPGANELNPVFLQFVPKGPPAYVSIKHREWLGFRQVTSHHCYLNKWQHMSSLGHNVLINLEWIL